MKRKSRPVRTYRLWTTGEVRRLAELRTSGKTIAACAKALARTPKSVQWGLHAHGLRRPAPPWRRRSGMLRRSAVRMKNAGRGVSFIADVLGVSRQAVYAALARAKNRGKK